MRNISDLMDELKRRRVFRVLIAYAVTAFVIIQIADIVFPALHLPEWTLTLVVVLIGIGFPIAIGLAWAFDLTSEGLVRTKSKQETTSDKAPHHLVIGNKSLAFITALAIIVAIWALFREPVPASAITSIAVLPLDNHMGDPDQDYFVDGMHEAIITELSHISALTVISRNSAMYYKNKNILTPVIAQELGVDALVEGSVLKAGNRVRITAQLIHGSSDEHLWANDYEGDITDILSLQKNIARAIAEEIGLVLTPEEQDYLDRTPQVNPEAYEHYLKGRFQLLQQTSDGMKLAKEHFYKALALKPDYADVYVSLAFSYYTHAQLKGDPQVPEWQLAKDAVNRALAIDPDLGSAHAVLTALYCMVDRDWTRARQSRDRALEIGITEFEAYSAIFYFDYAQGKYAELIDHIKQGMILDPLNPVFRFAFSHALFHAGRHQEAFEYSQQSLSMYPDFYLIHWNLAEAAGELGQLDLAIRHMEQAIDLGGDNYIFAFGFLGYLYAKADLAVKVEETLKYLEELESKRYVSRFIYAMIYSGTEDDERTLSLMERSFEVGDWESIYIMPWMDDQYGDYPRYQALMKKLGRE